MPTRHALGFFFLILGVFAPGLAHAYTPTGADITTEVIDTGTALTVPWDNPLIDGCSGNPPGFRDCGGFRITRQSDGAVINGAGGLRDDNLWANYSAEANGYVRTDVYSSYATWTSSPGPGNGDYYYEIISGPGYNNGDPSGSHTAPTVAYFRYTLSSGTPVIPPPAPTTDFNEVIDYIYDPVLDNSVGTSTVGARFSIPEPTWVTSVGFDLRGPLGNVLYTGSSSPTVPSSFDVSTSYYFDSAGAYELVAWFISDTGIKTLNPVSVYIVINAEPWVFDPVTGDLVPISSTTIATSTLTEFKVDCPDDVLVGSLCKLVVGMFIPSTSAIQSLQASFYGLMAKAPFSFFTQSKTVLEAFRVGTAATGGSLSLTLYGSEVDILSASTSANIGVDSGVIDLLKGVMIVGLWLLLAWYLYWRIASIFGV